MNRQRIQRAHIFWSPQHDQYVMKCPHNKQLVSEMQQLLDHPARYDYDAKVWKIHEEDLEDLKELLNALLGSHEFTARPPEANSFGTFKPTAGGEDIYREFLSLIPPDIARRLYTQAMTIYHPDHGGDEDKAKRLNVLWDTIRRLYVPTGA